MLYRKYRSKNFEQVVGQDDAVKTLVGQIKKDKISHAYVLTGTRGVGKTSLAKIFAKAINCEETSDNKPCNRCTSCKCINEGSSMDFLEIDAASNNGVDSIKDLIKLVNIKSTLKYKVFLLDEVHMLSTAAFNALLKTLEQPPAGVVFILATTELHKVPATILSRCQKLRN